MTDLRMIVVRILTRAARRLYVPRRGGPSPCCGRGEFLGQFTAVPDTLFCTRCGSLYPDRGWPR